MSQHNATNDANERRLEAMRQARDDFRLKKQLVSTSLNKDLVSWPPFYL